MTDMPRGIQTSGDIAKLRAERAAEDDRRWHQQDASSCTADEMSMGDIDDLLDELEASPASTPESRSRDTDNSWWDCAGEMRTFLAETYHLTATTIDLEPDEGTCRAQFDADDATFHLDLAAIDTISPVTRFTVGRVALTVDSRRPYGAFSDPRVQIPSARIFGLIHLTLAQHRYTTWPARIADDATEDVHADAAAVDPYDLARAQCLAAHSSVWMHPVIQAGYGLWITDAATVSDTDPVARLQWLITRIILLEKGGILPEDAALPATQQVTRHIGHQALDTIVAWVTPLLTDINPAAETMLTVGHQLRRLWTRLAAELEAAGVQASDIEITEAAQFATDALTTRVKQRLHVVARRWPARPWNSNTDSVGEEFDTEASRIARSAAETSHEIINDDQWGSLTGTLEAELRPVTDADRAMTAKIRSALARARTRRFGLGSTASATPGGRVNTRQLVQMQAQIAAGRKVTATPWTRRHSHHAAEPDVHAALVFDVSRSMGLWNTTAGPLSWSLINAVDQLGGSAAAWGFDGKVAPIARTAAYHGTQVPHLTGKGATSTKCAEALSEACRDAEFAGSTGAKVAIIVTDGDLGEAEFTEIQKEVSRQRRQGVSVYWVSAGVAAAAGWGPTGATRITLTDPDRFAEDVIATIVSEVAAA